jgi:hypothetical protein
MKSAKLVATLEREHPLKDLEEAIEDMVVTVADLYDLTRELRYKVEPCQARRAEGRPQRPLSVRQRQEVQGLPRRTEGAEPDPMRLQLSASVGPPPRDWSPSIPSPRLDAELLVLAGDIDSTWAGLTRFRGWPVPVSVRRATMSSTAATSTRRAPTCAPTPRARGW